jgi:hypothetical protein
METQNFTIIPGGSNLHSYSGRHETSQPFWELNTSQQIKGLKTFPFIREKLKTSQITREA